MRHTMRKFNIYVTPEKNFVTRQRSNKVSKDTKPDISLFHFYDFSVPIEDDNNALEN
jgi:hypothetical protein